MHPWHAENDDYWESIVTSILEKSKLNDFHHYNPNIIIKECLIRHSTNISVSINCITSAPSTPDRSAWNARQKGVAYVYVRLMIYDYKTIFIFL